MAVKIQLRRDTTEGWKLNGDNVVLAEGEIGIEFQENGYAKMKIGDGVQSWNALPYFAETISYNGLNDKPSINGQMIEGDLSLKDLGIQPAGNYVSPSDMEKCLETKQGILTIDENSGITIDEDGYIQNTKPNVQSDWYADSGDSAILNKPTLATVATSGSYNDLEDKPIIPVLPDPYVLPMASSEILGGVKIGDGINLTEDGTISVHTKVTDYEQLENRPKINGHDLNSESTSWDLGLATIAETKVRLDKKADKTEVEQCALKTDVTSVKESLKDYAKLTDLTDIKEQVIVITDKTDKIEEELETKVAKGNVYSKDEIDTKLKEIAVSGGVDLSNYYTKAEVDEDIESLGTSIGNLQSQVNNKANSIDVYTKAEVDTIVIDKADKADVYTKDEINDKLEELNSIYPITETRGTIALEADKMYTMTITGTTTFTLPTVTDMSKFHQIKLMIQVNATTTINWGTSYFFNKETPDIDSGNSYDVYYDYDNLLGQWVCGVIVKGVE